MLRVNCEHRTIFAEHIKPLISEVLGGQNSTIFTYEPRGSGKSYTIQTIVLCFVSLSEIPGVEHYHV